MLVKACSPKKLNLRAVQFERNTRDEGRATQSFDFAQGRELVERPAEWQMGVLRQPHCLKWEGQGVAD